MFKSLIKRFLNTTIKKKIIFLMGGVMTITPTILIALLASSYYYLGINKLFNNTIRSSLMQTVQIAEAYLQEHKENIKIDTLAVAHDIEMNFYSLIENPVYFSDFLNKQAILRNFSFAMIFTQNEVIAKTDLSFSLSFERLSVQILDNAKYNEVVLLPTNNDRVNALIKLDNFINTYLVIGKYVDKNILNYVKSSQGSANYYNKMLKDLYQTQLKLKVAFIILAMLLAFLSIYIAKKFAKKIALPINRLVDATAKVKRGDFSIRLPESDARDETAVLTREFNNMTKKLAQQRDELMQVNYMIDKRRMFIEAVLKEISAGVIVCSTDGVITLCNDQAYQLLEEKKNLLGLYFKDKLSEFELLLQRCKLSNTIVQENITASRRGKQKHFATAIGVEINPDNDIDGYIITFDDITDLIDAQRTAAWSDVAKRIAHEIKNPLTPISLATERLQHKFANEITSNPKLFLKYTNTIITHVNNIGKIVEDFVKFSKLNTVKKDCCLISEIINELIFSYHNTYPSINYSFDKLGKEDYIMCDRTQIYQVLINVIKNASEAIQIGGCQGGDVRVLLEDKESFVFVSIIDNGPGIPENIIDNLTQPYVTTKEKGTGLGLSIVKKIVEDHEGKVIIINNEDKGSTVLFSLKKVNKKPEV